MHKILRALTIPVAFSLAGCVSMKTPMTRFATDYNRVIADSRNEMILLNIVRAKNREPRHFSAFASVTGSLSVDGKLKIDTKNYIDGGANEASPSLEFNAKSSPSFQLIPLTTAEFVAGLLQPVSKDVIRTLVDQGFPSDLLAPLLIESVVCGDTEYRNDPRFLTDRDLPGAETALSDKHLFSFRFRLKPAEKQESMETVRLSEFQNLGSMSDFVQKLIAGQSVTAVNGNGLLNFKKATSADIEIAVDLSDDKAKDAWVALAPCVKDVPANRPAVQRPDFSLLSIVPKQPESSATQGPATERALEMVVRIRSVDAIVYYLGEIMRYRDKGLENPFDGRVIFNASSGADANSAIRVRHRDKVYSIPLPASASQTPAQARKTVDSRSLQTITLINHLIALQTSNDALKRPQTSISVN